jgi:hypothetical protein
MKRTILGLAAVILLSSCAQYKNVGGRNVLYNQYQEYISFLNENNDVAAIDLLSQRIVDDLVSNSSKKDFTKYFPVVSRINRVLSEEHGYFEEVYDRKGCLTVFGVDSSNEPTSVNMEYIGENGSWKLDYIQVMYHGSKDELPIKVTCPARM